VLAARARRDRQLDHDDARARRLAGYPARRVSRRLTFRGWDNDVVVERLYVGVRFRAGDTTSSRSSSSISSTTSRTSRSSADETTTSSTSDSTSSSSTTSNSGTTSNSSSSSSSDASSTTDPMPELRRAWVSDEGSDGAEGDDEWDDLPNADQFEDNDLDVLPEHDRSLGVHALEALNDLYQHRYNMPRNQLPHPPGQLQHLLHTMKHARPDHFRRDMRVNPRTFDKLVVELSDDPVFANQSHNRQMPVEEQVAIVLYRFGKSGNGAGLHSVANWAGVGKGTIVKVTYRVLIAMLRRKFLEATIRLPTDEEKEEAKEYVEKRSYKAWRGGWCFVDGTLIPLFDRPHWYHESYFDRKSNYSLNVQVSL
jgi:hypothetical protein